MSSVESGPAKPTIHATIFVRAPRDAPFEIRTLAERILTEFPGSYVAAEDSFEAERQRYRHVSSVSAQEGQSAQTMALVLESVNRKEAATGPGIDLCVPIDGEGELAGYVRARSVRFHTELASSHPGVRQFVRFLESLVGEQIQVFECP